MEKNEGNKLWPQYLATLTALIAGFSCGIHFGWPSPSLPKIQSDEYPFKMTQEEGSYVTVIGPIGDIVGNIIFSFLVDLIGRKSAILLIALPQIISYTMIYLSSYSNIFLYCGRFVGGIAEGACFTILPIYIGEISEPRVRGVLGSFFTLALMSGIMAVNLIGSYLTIHQAALVYLSVPFLFLATFIWMPESPYYLIIYTKIQKARESLIKLRFRRNVEDELSSLIKDVERQMAEPGRIQDLFLIDSNKRACFIIALLRILQQFSGMSSFAFYAQILFKEATDVIPEMWAAVLMNFTQTLFIFISSFIVDKIGRKPLIMFSTIGCIFLLTAMSVFFALKDWTPIDMTNFMFVPLVVLLTYGPVFGVGLGNTVNLMTGELFSASVKGKAVCLMNIIFAVSMFCSAKMYQFTGDKFGLAVPFMIFGCILFVGSFLCWKLVPETKGKSLEQIQQELKGNPVNGKQKTCQRESGACFNI